MEAVITRDMIMREVADRYPETLPVFKAFRVDFCCGGQHSIEITGRAGGVDVDKLMVALNQALAGEGATTR